MSPPDVGHVKPSPGGVMFTALDGGHRNVRRVFTGLILSGPRELERNLRLPKFRAFRHTNVRTSHTYILRVALKWVLSDLSVGGRIASFLIS